MNYSSNIDYLLPAIVYLGANQHWWARSSDELANELSLDRQKLEAVFEGFPSLFRRKDRAEGGPVYSLQARYARRLVQDVKPKSGEIPPLSESELSMLLTFVSTLADNEIRQRQNMVSVVAAIVAALAAIVAAVLPGFLN
ncbi:hypothetical protein [Maricaulis alexandrii]|uniref:hypothetical protein n=1 Tax=Maricaulis alexandrii TaxID=2570354 RepID=UPI001109E495|nr:hypothetical protein [Maricaulis alexandrii]